MTSELEKQFFDTFGIKAKEYKACDSFPCGNPRAKCGNCKDYKLYKTEYPQITDRILLELMELLMKQQATEFYYHDEYLFSSKLLCSNRPTCNRVKNLRELVLRTANCLGGFTPLKNKMLKQVRTLFEEMKNDNRN